MKQQELDTKSAPNQNAQPPRRKMSMAVINFWLDAALFLAIVAVVWISAMMELVFPAGTTAAGWSLWGLDYNRWRDVQFYAVCVGALLALEHLVLHWNWVCSVVATQVLRLKSRPDEGSQAIYGVGTFIVILVTFLASIIAALVSVKQPPM